MTEKLLTYVQHSHATWQVARIVCQLSVAWYPLVFALRSHKKLQVILLQGAVTQYALGVTAWQSPRRLLVKGQLIIVVLTLEVIKMLQTFSMSKGDV
jgi:hypothetical protein